MSVYEKKELVAQSFFQKLFKKQPKQNYMIELENKLFENEKSTQKKSEAKTTERVIEKSEKKKS